MSDLEFTGERVLPGRVEVDLWNEHISRYVYASRYAPGRRVLDAGCGAGYGADLLAEEAASAVGIDVASDAVHLARESYRSPIWTVASASQLPFASGSFDLITCFEVIEHIPDWQQLIHEADRALGPNGIFIVSTPNKSFYADARAASGPNPYHHHEFEYEEFRTALTSTFRFVSIVLQNHADCILFEAASLTGAAGHMAGASDPGNANYYVAICSQQPFETLSLVYVPEAANLLKERSEHIRRLEEELRTKDCWLLQSQQQHAELVQLHDTQTAELKTSNAWAQETDQKLRASQNRVVELQAEVQRNHQAAAEIVERYEAALQSVRQELEERTVWARNLESDFASDIRRCTELLDKAEATVVERTNWAQNLQTQLEQAQSQLAGARSSRWVKLGRTLNVGPELGS